jgi:ribosomal protein S18 acetylase RimI-like enzyme
METRRATETDRMRLAEFAAHLQRHPDRHIAYLANDPDTIAAEMIEEDDDWTAASAVAEQDGEILGWLMGSVEADMGRVWWYGPFVAGDRWAVVADALYDHARSLLDDSVDEEEMAVDIEFSLASHWACGRGFVAEEGSLALTLGHALDPPSIPIRLTTADDLDTVGRLHDELFPGTHTPGHRLIGGADASHIRLVAERDHEVLGYVAVERQPDGTGYIDFIGVEPARRRQGIGAELIRAGVAELRAIGCESTHLTVRQHSEAARALYASLGFTEERLIIPLRKGFSLS